MKHFKLSHVLLGLIILSTTAVGVTKITNSNISSTAAIAFSKLASLTSAHILVGSAGNVPTDVAVTGDISLTNGGVTAYSGTVPVNKGGTGQTTFTDGQIMIGNTSGNTLTKATLTQGSGISITNGNGSITIASSGTGLATEIYSKTTAGTDTFAGASTRYVYVKAAGGGGGGGGGAQGNPGAEAGQGGGGSACEGLLAVTNQTYDIVVGAGGAAGAATGPGTDTGTSGSAGADTTITDAGAVVVFRCKGGFGGGHGTSDTTIKWYRNLGGWGGIPSCNTIVGTSTAASAAGNSILNGMFLPGASGPTASNGSGAPCPGGGGGAGEFGNGGAGGGSNSCTAGSAGTGGGGGGGGGSGSAAVCNGGAGGAGGAGGLKIYSL